MFTKSLSIIAASALLVLQSLNAKHLIIDDFDNYGSTPALRANWNSFGSAASSGPAQLALGMGYADSDAAMFNLNWDAGNNANMRLFRPSAKAQNLSPFVNLLVWLKIQTEEGNFYAPTKTTTLRIAIEGNNETIWQTKPEHIVKVNFEQYQGARFTLNDSEMIRVAGKGGLNDTLSDIKSIRLRFENQSEPLVRQDVYIDSIVATSASE